MNRRAEHDARFFGADIGAPAVIENRAAPPHAVLPALKGRGPWGLRHSAVIMQALIGPPACCTLVSAMLQRTREVQAMVKTLTYYISFNHLLSTYAR